MQSRSTCKFGIFFTLLVVCLGYTIPSARALSSAEMLPKGVRALAIVYADAPNVDSTFNSGGAVESLARPLNRSITLDDLAPYEPRLKLLRNTLNSLSADNLGDQLLVANLFSDVKVHERRYVYALMWGISDSFSAGVIVPYISRDTKANFTVNTTNNAAAIRKVVGENIPQVSDGLTTLANTPIDTKLFQEKVFVANGYKVPESFTATGMGDIEVDLRNRYFNSEYLSLGTRATIKLPTSSHSADMRNLLDRDFGEETYSLKLGTVHSVRIFPEKFSFHTAAYGTYRMPQKKRMAFARTSDQNLPDITDPYQIETVKRHLGSQLDLEAGFSLDFWKGMVSIFSSYQHSVRASDKISGNRNLDYARSTMNTSSISRAYESGIEFSTVPLYFAKKVPAPGKIVGTFVQPISGVNSLYAKYGRLDAILFF